MRIQYYEIVDEKDKAYRPPWLTLMQGVAALSPPDRRVGRDTANVYWRTQSNPRPQDAVIELARDREQSPAVSDSTTGRISPAANPGRGRAYAERIVAGLVDDRVVGCVQIGGGAARPRTVASNINVMLGLTASGNAYSAVPLYFQRLLSPGFLSRLQQPDSLVAGIELEGRYAGVTRMMGGGGVLARSKRLAGTDAQLLKAKVAIALDSKKRNIDNLTPAERAEARELFEEALELVANAEPGVRGQITMITKAGRKPVHLGDAHLNVPAKLPKNTGPYPDPLLLLDAMHKEYAPLMSQVRSMLRP